MNFAQNAKTWENEIFYLFPMKVIGKYPNDSEMKQKDIALDPKLLGQTGKIE